MRNDSGYGLSISNMVSLKGLDKNKVQVVEKSSGVHEMENYQEMHGPIFLGKG